MKLAIFKPLTSTEITRDFPQLAMGSEPTMQHNTKQNKHKQPQFWTKQANWKQITENSPIMSRWGGIRML
jgi:hypothetical protein